MNVPLQARSMKLSEELAEKMIEGMEGRRRKNLVLKLGDHLISSLGPEDRKDLMVRMIPSMMEKVLEGLGPQEKAALVRQLMPGDGGPAHGPPRAMNRLTVTVLLVGCLSWTVAYRRPDDGSYP